MVALTAAQHCMEGGGGGGGKGGGGKGGWKGKASFSPFEVGKTTNKLTHLFLTSTF